MTAYEAHLILERIREQREPRTFELAVIEALMEIQRRLTELETTAVTDDRKGR